MQRSLVTLPHPVRGWLSDLLYTLAFLIVGWKYTRGLDTTFDLGLYDETNYLHRGLQLVRHGILPAPDWGLLYSAWYALLSFFQPDPVALYYLNHRVLCSLLALAVYGTLRVYGTPHLAAAVCAFLVLLADLNVYMWPRVTLFALLIILGSFMIAAAIRNRMVQLGVMAFAALLAAYVRPEYFVVAIWCLLLLAAWTVNYAQQGRLAVALSAPACVTLAILAVSGVVTLVGLGLPVGGGERSMAAFRQHFSLNWVRWTGSTLDPWTDYDTIISENFGQVDSIAAAVAQNPQAFLRHAEDNLRGIFTRAVQLALYDTSVLRSIWPAAPWAAREEATVMLLVLIGGLAAWLVWRGLTQPQGETVLPAAMLWGAAGYLIAGVVSMVAIYPRPHYLVAVILLLVVVAAALIVRRFGVTPAVSLRGTLIACAALLLITPTFAQQHRFGQPNLATVRALQALDLRGPVNLLEAQGGFHVYLGDHAIFVRPFTKTQPFDHFLLENRINIIVLSDRLRADSRLRDDPEWQGFLEQATARGWQRLPIGGIQRELLIAPELWSPLTP